MATVVEFYIPKTFQKPSRQVLQLQWGKVVEFCSRTKKSA
jgi:hypothetical protein